MWVTFASKELRRICLEPKVANKRLTADCVKALRRRLDDLYAYGSLKDLIGKPGHWEQLVADRSGSWSARLTKNWRLVVDELGQGDPTINWDEVSGYEPPSDEGEQQQTVTVVRVIEIGDYH
jgi:proteic killer suppression protein